MRKKFLSILITIFALCICMFTLTACGENELPHVHVYQQQVVNDNFKASDATCVSKAVYYYSCTCGEKGTETFEYGEKSSHVYNEGKCKWCEEDEPIVHTHDYKEQVADSKYLKTNATCESKAVYYYSCTCGEKGTETFEYGSSLGHAYGDWISNNDGTHTKTCENESSHKITEKCSGDLTCTVCGAILIPHTEGLVYEIIDGEVGVIDYTGNANEVIIPSTYQGYPVTSIGERAFRYCNSLTSIEIPSSVTSIGDYAFYGCGSLKNIKIPNGVTIIGNAVFYCCNSLINIEIPNGVISIGSHAFYNCSLLTRIEIPNSVTSVGKYVFYNCSLLAIYCKASGKPVGWDEEWNSTNCPVEWGYGNDEEGVATEGLVYEIIDGKAIITDYVGTATEVIISNHYKGYPVTSIGFNAFEYCYLLKSIVIGNNVKSIGDYAFSSCSSLTNVTIGENLTSIGDFAFSSCEALTGIELSNSIKLIGDYAFSQCKLLASIEISNNVTSIGNSTFFDCGSLKSVTIGSSVTKINSGVFSNCASLESIIVDENNEYYKTIDDNLYNKEGTVLIKYAIGKKDATFTIPKDVTSIGDWAFHGATFLIDIEISLNISSIGNWAFSSCNSLKSVIIGKNLTSIGVNAFEYCTSLKSIVIPNNVTNIGTEAFYCCDLLTIYCEALSKPDGWSDTWNSFNYIVEWGYGSNQNDVGTEGLVYKISNGEVAVTGYVGTSTEVVIPSIYKSYPVTSIGENAFYWCDSLTSIEIPNSVTNIGKGAIYRCNSLTQIILPFVGESNDGINNTYFGYIFGADDYLYNASVTSSLKEITITGGSSIGDWAFYRCYSISSVEIPSSVTSIGVKAFCECSSLTSVTIGDSVVSIGEDAFYDCTSLTSVTIGNSVTSIGEDAFYDCYRLVEIYNKSNLNIIADSSNYGRIGYYALNVYTEEGGSKLSTDTNGYVIYTDGDDKILIGYSGIEINLNLPSGITAINKFAFWYFSSLTSIVIPNTVTSIGGHAFSGCSSLTEIKYTGTIDEWVQIEFGSSPLSYGKNLYINDRLVTEVVLTTATKINDYAFYDYSSLISVTIGNSVTSIGDYAFNYCSSLTSVTIGNSVTSIGDYAFSGCYSIISVVIPNGVTSIGDYAFSGCALLANLEIGEKVTSIGDYAFSGCYKLVEIYNKSILDITVGAEEYGCVGEYALAVYKEPYTSRLSIDSDGYMTYTYGNYKILIGYSGKETNLTLPNGITAINRFAFCWCDTLTRIEIPSSVTSIGERAFFWCESLTSIKIPNSVTNIGEGAFAECNRFTEITLPFIGTYKYGNNNTHFGYIFGAETYDYNNGYIPTSLKKVVITGGSSIDDSAFLGCTSLTSIEIPNSVTRIGENAFLGCNSLQYYIKDGLKYLGNNENPCLYLADVEAKTITTANIDSNCKIMGYYMFSDCTSLTSVVIPNSVTSIGDYAFSNCPIETATIPTLAISSIPKGNLKTVVVNGGNYIGKDAFKGCTSLTSIELPNSVIGIGVSAFEGCTSLANIELPNSVTSIGEDAFEGCSSLQYSVKDGLNYLGNSENNHLYLISVKNISITSAIIDSKCKLISYYAFKGCTSLTSVVIPNSVTSIGDYAFEGCSSLTIYCEAESKPSGWDSDWNYSNCPVVWGHKGE